MPRLRDLTIRVMPAAWTAVAERDSRLWSVTCQTCGRVGDVWLLGGMRWRAHRGPLTAFPCPGCGRMRMHRLDWTGPGSPAGRWGRSPR